MKLSLDKGKRWDVEGFKFYCSQLHSGKYNYDRVNFKNCKDIIEILCLKHGWFKQRACHHIVGKKCINCAKEDRYAKITSRRLEKKFVGVEQPEDYKLIPLTQGKFTMVDNEDFDNLKDINWQLSAGYARQVKNNIHMHRFIMNCPDDKVIDHINHNKLDNRKSNLRICDMIENQCNKRPEKGKLTKGVRKIGNRYVANIKFKDLQISKSFYSEEEALNFYDLKALELQGEFAYLNFPENKEEYLKQIEDEKKATEY